MKQQIVKKRIGYEVLQSARELYRENETRLEEYLDYLLEWNEKINLVSRAVSRETVREHVVHSLIPEALHLLNGSSNWVDAGSGGGLPGAPLAICKVDCRWTMNDNVKKKMRAVDDMIQKLGLKNAEIAAKSISLVDLKRGTGIVTKHAFKIDDLLRLLDEKSWEEIIMWKGAKDAEQELHQTRKKVNATIYEFDFGTDEPFYEGKAIVVLEP